MTDKRELPSIQNSKLSRRTFLRVAMTGAAGAFLVSCTVPPTQSTGSAPAAGAAENKAVSVFECCWDAPHIEAGKQLYKDFQSQNPDIAVTEFWPAPGDDWATELLSKVAANEQVDIIWWCSSHHKFAEEGRLSICAT